MSPVYSTMYDIGIYV